MKALYFEQHGELDVIQYGDVPEPETGPGQVKIRVRATALNYLDIWVQRGWPGLKLEMPHWCGADVAGEIVELGEGVTEWQVGQRVVADPGVNLFEDEYTARGEDCLSPGYHILGEHQRGGAADYIVLPAGSLATIPDRVGFEEAAATGAKAHVVGQWVQEQLFFLELKMTREVASEHWGQRRQQRLGVGAR